MLFICVGNVSYGLNYWRSSVNTKSTRVNNIKASLNASLDPETIREIKQKKEIERLRAAEKFMEIDEGKFECQACGYLYEPIKGDRFAGIDQNTLFSDLPDNFVCPACKSSKSQFKPVKKIIAGFAENQQYGLGGNSLTGDQKSLLIYGLLSLAFFLFLSGYLLE